MNEVVVRQQKIASGQVIGFCLSIEKECCLFGVILSSVKINVFQTFFTFRLKMHTCQICNNQKKTGAEGGTILGQPMLLEYMGICVLSPAYECEMRGSLVHLLNVKYLFH